MIFHRDGKHSQYGGEVCFWAVLPMDSNLENHLINYVGKDQTMYLRPHHGNSSAMKRHPISEWRQSCDQCLDANDWKECHKTSVHVGGCMTPPCTIDQKAPMG